MRREAGLLKGKAISSLRRMVAAFNGLDEDGRQNAVVRELQHTFEMLLKASLREKNVPVFDKRTGRSIGFKKCVELARQHLKLSEEQLGLLRAIDALRDDEQHWLADLNEGLLYVHARGAITLFDEILEAIFGERLASHLPGRVLPISTKPLVDVEILIDEQYGQIQDLLKPGKRRRAEARAMARGLLALEGHVAEDARVSERDVNRVERAIRDGKKVSQVFPRLATIGATYSGEGPMIEVRFTKREGAPVSFISADDPREAAAIRQVDLERKYYLSKTALAERVGLTPPRATALRRHLGIDEDEDCVHVFQFDSQRHYRYSDNALRKMKEALGDGVDMDLGVARAPAKTWRFARKGRCRCSERITRSRRFDAIRGSMGSRPRRQARAAADSGNPGEARRAESRAHPRTCRRTSSRRESPLRPQTEDAGPARRKLSRPPPRWQICHLGRTAQIGALARGPLLAERSIGLELEHQCGPLRGAQLTAQERRAQDVLTFVFGPNEADGNDVEAELACRAQPLASV
jgi:hypothetical protein